MAQTTSTVDVGTLDGTPAAAETTRPWLQPTGLEVPALQIILEANIPAILWGMPGEGKTASIEALAALQGAHLEVIIGSQFSAHDIAGVPQVIGNEVHHIPPLWAKILAEQPADRRTILFLDELDKCPHETQNAALRIIRERQVGVLRLPSQCRVVAAANPPHLGGWDLPSAIANRFVHLDWALDIPAVLEGLTTGNWPRLRALQIAAADISEPLAFWRGLTTAFLAERTDLIRDMATSIHSQGRAWPSPRSWEMLQQVMAVAYAVGVKPDLEQVLVTGCVGQQAARHLLSWAMPLRSSRAGHPRDRGDTNGSRSSSRQPDPAPA
jgi:MoxR-like ATPase